jgi:hypothetical protein
MSAAFSFFISRIVIRGFSLERHRAGRNTITIRGMPTNDKPLIIQAKSILPALPP